MNSRPCRPASFRPLSFTLVEMLVAVAIFSLLALVICGVLGQFNNAWTKSSGQNERQQNGRALLNFLAQNIEQAMMPLNGATNSLQFVIDSANLPAAYGNRDSIFFQAPVATDGSAGEVAEVGYFVQWQPNNTAQLCRFLVNPTDTANYQIYTNTSSWLSQGIVQEIAGGAAPGYAGLLGENVIGLWINAYVRSVTNGVTDFNVVNQYDSRTNNSTLPVMVDISILALDSVTAKRLSSASVTGIQAVVRNATNAAEGLANLSQVSRAVQAGASSFSTRVPLINAH